MSQHCFSNALPASQCLHHKLQGRGLEDSDEGGVLGQEREICLYMLVFSAEANNNRQAGLLISRALTGR